MLKIIAAGCLSGALLIATTALPAFGQAEQKSTAAEKKADDKAADKKADEKTAKPLTAQQQKMKDCGAKWQVEKTAKNVKGQQAYRTFLKGCLAG